MEAAPALLLPIKLTVPLLLILAASAVLLSWNVRLPVRRPAIPVVKVAFPALLELANTTLDVGAKKKLGELEELLTIPAPVNSRLLAKGTLNEYADAPGLKVNPPMGFAPKTVSPVIVDAANVAVPVGTARVDQLSGLLKVPVKGTVRHVAFWAWPELTPSTPAMTLAANNCPRMAPRHLSWPVNGTNGACLLRPTQCEL